MLINAVIAVTRSNSHESPFCRRSKLRLLRPTPLQTAIPLGNRPRGGVQDFGVHLCRGFSAALA